MANSKKKLKVAYFSPLPPSRTGISDRSAMLLPFLSEHYELDVVVDVAVTDSWVNKHLAVRDVSWFIANANEYDRVIYHIGNSSFHYYMFDLIERYPGVIVLHDFFLGHAVSGIDAMGLSPGYWVKSIYISHGQPALYEWFKELDLQRLQWKYPVNAQVIKYARGVIVHGQYSKQLAESWYGENYAAHWAVIPLVRELPELPDRKALRRRYGFRQKDFLVCSFGMLGRSKLNDRLLAAWLNSELMCNSSAQLIFVGEPDNGDFGQIFSDQIEKSGYSERIKITGWLDDLSYREYLVMADMAVQLRGSSRGEISAALHDCMAYGLPTIINAQDCFSETNANALFKVSKDFSDDELTQALNLLSSKKNYRKKIANEARLEIELHHNPKDCAQKYFDAIESFYSEESLQNKFEKVEESNVEQISEWMLIKDLRKVHIDSEADLYLRMCAHRQLVEDELALTKKQLNVFLASRSWRFTKPIREMEACAIRFLHLSNLILLKTKFRLKQLRRHILSFRLLLIECLDVTRQVKSYLALNYPWVSNFIKFLMGRPQKSSGLSSPEIHLSRTERMIYERLKMALKDKN